MDAINKSESKYNKMMAKIKNKEMNNSNSKNINNSSGVEIIDWEKEY